MKETAIQCGRCCRSCAVKVAEDKNIYYIGGNKCVGGEQTVREQLPELQGCTFKKLEDLSKKGLLGRILASLKR